jgi:hypothetical protein
MGFAFNKSYLCINQKRWFLILLLFNLFVTGSYHFYGSILHSTDRSTIPIDGYQKQNYAIKFIRNILENEYDHQDLMTFYNLVEKEFSLGLRCTKKANPPLTIVLSNISNLTTNQQTNSSITTIRYLNKKMVRYFSSIYIREKRNLFTMTLYSNSHSFIQY